MFIETLNGWINLSRTSQVMIGDLDSDRGATAVKFNTTEGWVSSYVRNVDDLLAALRSGADGPPASTSLATPNSRNGRVIAH